MRALRRWVSPSARTPARWDGTLLLQRFAIAPIGVIESPLTDHVVAPKQGVESSPEAWLLEEDDGLRLDPQGFTAELATAWTYAVSHAAVETPVLSQLSDELNAEPTSWFQCRPGAVSGVIWPAISRRSSRTGL